MKDQLVNQYHTEFLFNGIRHTMTGSSSTEIQNQIKNAVRIEGNVRFEKSGNSMLVYSDSHLQAKEPLCAINELQTPEAVSVAWQSKKAAERVAA